MIHTDIIQASLGAAVAAAGYLTAQLETHVPKWVSEYGAPTVMLAGSLWALVHVYKELTRERLARIEDRDRMIDQMRADSMRGDSTREALLRATIEQTNEFKTLRRELTRNGHTKDDA
jgi:hypothetical protein